MYLSLVHLRKLVCRECGALLAEPGARSFVVDAEGEAVKFDEQDQPAEMQLEMICPNGHSTGLFVPNEISAEETLATPDEAPLAGDAILMSGTTESGATL
jgi:hypothetical protein